MSSEILKSTNEQASENIKKRNIKKQLFRFLIAGFSAVGTDFGTYFILLNYLSEPSAKSISFVLGTIVAFIINKFWTFEKKSYSHLEVIKFILLYASTLVANVGINQFVLWFFPGQFFIAFLCATGTSTILNFIGQKWWVFVESEASI